MVAMTAIRHTVYDAQTFMHDVKDVKYVLNYDFPKNVEDYVHRIGRTGRGGATGTSVTYFTMENVKQASELLGILREAKQEIDPKLEEMARFGGGGGRGAGRGGRGGRGGYGRGGYGGGYGRGGYGGGMTASTNSYGSNGYGSAGAGGAGAGAAYSNGIVVTVIAVTAVLLDMAPTLTHPMEDTVLITVEIVDGKYTNNNTIVVAVAGCFFRSVTTSMIQVYKCYALSPIITLVHIILQDL
ncbi:hypothetical protein BDF22DRAFT_137144 [Syncephalis plumigaleata]|nr:hypothetical protein BDF22DRAFT_137144 [Syncephalis plumigaleata]